MWCKVTSCLLSEISNFGDIYNSPKFIDQISNYFDSGLIKMPSILGDIRINQLIKERKSIPRSPSKFKRKIVGGHYRLGTSIISLSGEKYYLYCNESIDDPAEFSVGLGYEKRDVNKLFLLHRYNAPDYPGHENPIEEEIIDGFHIHIATERYQKFGKKQEEKYATATTRFNDSESALACLLTDCGVLEGQSTLQDWEERDGY